MKRLVVTKLTLIAGLLVAITIPWQLGGKEPIALTVSLLVVFLALILQFNSERMNLSQKFNPPWPLLAFGAWGALTLLWSVNRYQTVIWLLVLSIGLAAYTLARSLARNERSVKWWMNGYILIAIIFSIQGLVIYVTQSYERLTSSFYLANPFAAFVLPAVILSAWLYVRFGHKLHGIGAAVLLAAVYLTDSRSIFIMLILAVLCLSAVKLKIPSWLRLASVLVLAVGMILTANFVRHHLYKHATALQGARFTEIANGQASNGSDRLYYLRSVGEIWRHYPWGGSGAGTFSSIHGHYQLRVVSASANAHNLYAQTLAESGVVGVVLLLIVVAAILRLVWQCFKQQKMRVLAVIIVLMLIHFGLDIDAAYPVIIAVFATLVGFVAAGLAPDKSFDARLSATPLVLVITLVASLIAGSAYYSSRASAQGQYDQDQGNYMDAANEFATAHRYPVYDPDVLTAEGINYYTLAGLEQTNSQATIDLKQAEKLAREAHVLDPYDAQHSLLLARALLRRGNQNGAILAYDTAISLDPYNHPEYYLDLAKLYLRSGQPKLAATVADKILRQYPQAIVDNRSFVPGLVQNLSYLRLIHAQAVLTQANIVEARSDLKAAIKLYPGNTNATQLLSQLSSS